ncbi:MAG TPA: TadE/TadG family type IV pilus assembly protein [Caulobacteraceae bacterium]|nr:TadE/TadG family type IV pilus assembly protein [Caulobacteraceae bacterium]
MDGLLHRAMRRIAGFPSARGGVAAVEFALIATPFFMLLFGIVELGLLFMSTTNLEAATIDASRAIRTGSFQQSGTPTLANFKATVCADEAWLSSSDCNANVVVDVRTFADFSAISVSPPVTNNALDPSKTQFSPGTPCSVVLVRVFYPYTLMAPLLEPGMPNLGPGKRLLTSTVAFRNEDYAGLTPCS